MKPIKIGIGYGWASEGVYCDDRWQELKGFCKSAASQGRNSALASVRRPVSTDDDELEEMPDDRIPNVNVSRLRASVGRFTWDSIKEHIDDSDVLVFDLTPTRTDAKGQPYLTSNVWLEIGYALARPEKRVFLVHADEKGHTSLPSDLNGLIVGCLPHGDIPQNDISLRSSLAGEVSRLIRARLGDTPARVDVSSKSPQLGPPLA